MFSILIYTKNLTNLSSFADRLDIFHPLRLHQFLSKRRLGTTGCGRPSPPPTAVAGRSKGPSGAAVAVRQGRGFGGFGGLAAMAQLPGSMGREHLQV